MRIGIGLTVCETTVPGCVAVSTMSLIMPETSFGSSDIDVRSTTSTEASMSSAATWTALDLDHSTEGWDSITYTATADTTQQEMVDITGSGVVTHIAVPSLNFPGVITVTLEVDGVTEVYTSGTMTNPSSRFCMGDFRHHKIVAATDYIEGIAGSHDTGFANTGAAYGFMTNPVQTLSEGRIGIPFLTSFNCKFQGSSAITSSSYANRGVVCLSNYIPKGVV